MHRVRLSLLPVLLWSGTACGQGDPQRSQPAPDSAAVAEASGLADALGRELMGMLLAALEEHGPEAAAAYCADSAQMRSSRHRSSGRTVRRVGTRIRNPVNSPDSLEQAVLAAFELTRREGSPPRDTAFIIDGTLHYARPIMVAEGCLACHGPVDSLAPGVAALLADRYPEDAATGYAVGDLRGAISVRLALDDR